MPVPFSPDRMQTSLRSVMTSHNGFSVLEYIFSGIRVYESVGDTCREGGGEALDAGGDLVQAVGAMVDGVHACDVGQQRLRGADVGRRLVPPATPLHAWNREAKQALIKRTVLTAG